MSEKEKPIKLYYSSVPPSLEVATRQKIIVLELDAKKIDYEMIDVFSSTKSQQEMRAIMGSSTGKPPQICNGYQYCGNYEMFQEALEENRLKEFLKLTSQK